MCHFKKATGCQKHFYNSRGCVKKDEDQQKDTLKLLISSSWAKYFPSDIVLAAICAAAGWYAKPWPEYKQEVAEKHKKSVNLLNN